MPVFRRKNRHAQNEAPKGARQVRIQPGASEKDGFKLVRKNRHEILYFRTKEDRDLAAKADKLAYDLLHA